MTDVETVARKKCAATTREAMLIAARERFANENYENVGLRDVARDVGVDVALVGRYFGSKEELFKKALRGDEAQKFEVEGGAKNLPSYLASLVDGKDDKVIGEHAKSLLIMLRSASSPAAAKIVREAIREDVLDPIAASLHGDCADARAGLSLAILMGTTVLRAIMGVHPLCDADRQFLDRKLPGVFKAALSDHK